MCACADGGFANCANPIISTLTGVIGGISIEMADTGIAEFDLDPFSLAFLSDPYAHHAQLREAGAAVRLRPYGVWASARFAEVKASLQNWEVFSSAAGVGLTDFRKETPWRRPSLVLEADPPLHSRTRPVLATALSPGVLKKLRDAFRTEAETLIGSLLSRGAFDGITDLAEVLPIKVFADALGLPREGREHLLAYAAAVFNAFGPRNELFEQTSAKAAVAQAWVAAQCTRQTLAPGSIGAQVFAAADRGDVTEEEAALLVRSLLSAGLDTTVHGLGNALFCLGAHPEQWMLLREEPGRARAAFEEVLRFESPVQTFFRTTTCETQLGDVRLGEGEKVLLFLGAANRDGRHWSEPGRFDITRNAGGHVAFGSGIHGCVGQMVARLEGEIVLTTLAQRVRTIEIVATPVWKPNNTLRGLGSLPLRFG
jgi:cytochrome P450